MYQIHIVIHTVSKRQNSWFRKSLQAISVIICPYPEIKNHLIGKIPVAFTVLNVS